MHAQNYKRTICNHDTPVHELLYECSVGISWTAYHDSCVMSQFRGMDHTLHTNTQQYETMSDEPHFLFEVLRSLFDILSNYNHLGDRQCLGSRPLIQMLRNLFEGMHLSFEDARFMQCHYCVRHSPEPETLPLSETPCRNAVLAVPPCVREPWPC